MKIQIGTGLLEVLQAVVPAPAAAAASVAHKGSRSPNAFWQQLQGDKALTSARTAAHRRISVRNAATVPPPDHDKQQQWKQQQQQQQQDQATSAVNASSAKITDSSSVQHGISDMVTVDCGPLSDTTGCCSTAAPGTAGFGTAGSSSTGCRRAETRLVLEFCDCGTLRSFVSKFWKLEQQQQQQQQGQTEAVTDPVGPSSSDARLLQLVLLLLGRLKDWRCCTAVEWLMGIW